MWRGAHLCKILNIPACKYWKFWTPRGILNTRLRKRRISSRCTLVIVSTQSFTSETSRTRRHSFFQQLYFRPYWNERKADGHRGEIGRTTKYETFDRRVDVVCAQYFGNYSNISFFPLFSFLPFFSLSLFFFPWQKLRIKKKKGRKSFSNNELVSRGFWFQTSMKIKILQLIYIWILFNVMKIVKILLLLLLLIRDLR